MKNSTWFTY